MSSQFWKQKLGDYSISKDLGCPRPGCRSYRVHLNGKFYPFFTADVYQLNDNLNMHRLEEIVSEKKQWIDEIFVVTKNEREYMAVVYNERKVLAESMYLEKIRMTPVNCKRLMIEALQLIK